MVADDTRVPVTILTGYLGSGKTTLVNHILSDKTHGKKIAIIENEFGDVGIDDALMAKNAKEQVEEEIIEMMNGCICCTVRQDLVVVLKNSPRMKQGKMKKLDCVLIETTGMADPAPVAQTFFVDDEVKENFRLDGIVTLIDAKHVEQHLDEEKPEGQENEVVEQVAFADRMILNKTDLVTEDDLVRVEKRLKSMNSSAGIIRTERSAVSVDNILDIRAFDLKKTVEWTRVPEHRERARARRDGEFGERGREAPAGPGRDPALVQLLARQQGFGSLSHEGISERRQRRRAVHVPSRAHDLQRELDEPWQADETRRAVSCSSARTSTTTRSNEGLRSVCTPRSRKEKARVAAIRLRRPRRVQHQRRMGRGRRRGKDVNEMTHASRMVAPYQIELHNGTMIWAPEDDDDFIRAGKKAKTSA